MVSATHNYCSSSNYFGALTRRFSVRYYLRILKAHAVVRQRSCVTNGGLLIKRAYRLCAATVAVFILSVLRPRKGRLGSFALTVTNSLLHNSANEDAAIAIMTLKLSKNRGQSFDDIVEKTCISLLNYK